MLAGQGIATLVSISARSVRRWLLSFGGIGLIPLALLDNSPIPIPGAMDVATIVLAARQPQWWLYYAVMATLGSLLGGYLTYRLARRGGQAALERRFSRRRVAEVTKIFARWGFGSIAIPALLPPPMPMVPFVFAAGAMQYPAKKFLAALTVGRTIRYFLLAYLAAQYGRHIIAIIVKHGHPYLVGVILAAIAVAFAVFYFWPGTWRKPRTRTSPQRS
ncbi:MAG: VTT domain-containing protein [Candidatus Acidiferrales bacterium]